MSETKTTIAPDHKEEASDIKIIVGGKDDKPCYSLQYYDLRDNDWHIGYSSYDLNIVLGYIAQYFNIHKTSFKGCAVCNGTGVAVNDK